MHTDKASNEIQPLLVGRKPNITMATQFSPAKSKSDPKSPPSLYCRMIGLGQKERKREKKIKRKIEMP